MYDSLKYSTGKRFYLSYNIEFAGKIEVDEHFYIESLYNKKKIRNKRDYKISININAN